MGSFIEMGCGCGCEMELMSSGEMFFSFFSPPLFVDDAVDANETSEWVSSR